MAARPDLSPARADDGSCASIAADAPETVPDAVLKQHARDLRASRERLQQLLADHGTRDDVEAGVEGE
jgi:hypothetical protein